MADDNYSGDLEGNPVLTATSMRCGVCQSGNSIGIDLLDADGKTMVHGHLDIETAMEFSQSYCDAIEALLEAASEPITIN